MVGEKPITEPSSMWAPGEVLMPLYAGTRPRSSLLGNHCLPQIGGNHAAMILTSSIARSSSLPFFTEWKRLHEIVGSIHAALSPVAKYPKPLSHDQANETNLNSQELCEIG